MFTPFVLLMFRSVWPAHVGAEEPRPVAADTDSFFLVHHKRQGKYVYVLKVASVSPSSFYVHMKYSESFFSLSPLDFGTHLLDFYLYKELFFSLSCQYLCHLVTEVSRIYIAQISRFQ